MASRTNGSTPKAISFTGSVPAPVPVGARDGSLAGDEAGGAEGLGGMASVSVETEKALPHAMTVT